MLPELFGNGESVRGEENDVKVGRRGARVRRVGRKDGKFGEAGWRGLVCGRLIVLFDERAAALGNATGREEHAGFIGLGKLLLAVSSELA